jgi:hypothetical protein
VWFIRTLPPMKSRYAYSVVGCFENGSFMPDTGRSEKIEFAADLR